VVLGEKVVVDDGDKKWENRGGERSKRLLRGSE
jgi:hypothetical protein